MVIKTWLAVDGHGNEYAFNEEPYRDFPNLDLRVKWGQRWVAGTSIDPTSSRIGVRLANGTIELLTGHMLTYSDEPFLWEFEDNGNYTETREEVLKSDNDTLPIF